MAHPLKHRLKHLGGTVAFPDCGTVLPLGFPSLGFEGLAFSFPSSPLSFALVGGALVGGDLGPLGGGALASCPGCWPALAHPVKIRVSTYCETGLASGIISAEMKNIQTQETVETLREALANAEFLLRKLAIHPRDAAQMADSCRNAAELARQALEVSR